MKPGSWRVAARHTSPLPRRSRWRARLVVEGLEDRALPSAARPLPVHADYATADSGGAVVRVGAAAEVGPRAVLDTAAEAEPNDTAGLATPVTVPTHSIVTAAANDWLTI